MLALLAALTFLLALIGVSLGGKMVLIGWLLIALHLGLPHPIWNVPWRRP